jgi:hypothetical protein
MSRSGYSDCCDGWELIRWRGAVASAIRGKRGQQLLREMATALDAMPEKRLIAEELQTPDGEVCALGCVGRARSLDMTNIDAWDTEQVSKAFGIARALAAEVAFVNDDWINRHSDPEKRWEIVRRWVKEHLQEA